MLAITIVSVNLSTMLAMNMSAYQTGISYGAEGAEALKSFYKKTAVVYTSREGMIANCGNIKFMLMSEALDNPDKLLELLKTQKPDTFVYGTACNSYSQLRDCIGSEKVSAELKNDYLTLNFGSYTVAQRKKN
jgi:hypothetical protein